MEIVQLLASPVHRFEGRPADGPAAEVPGELVDEVRVRAGLGIVGDRFFGKRAHREAAVTIQAAEALPPGIDLRHVRRNILTRGIDVDALPFGAELSLDSGDGPVRFGIRRPAHPCAWLDVTMGPGTWRSMRGRSGVRCVPLDDGVLRVGPVHVEVT